MERLTHYNFTDANGFTLSVDDQEKANIELARYENIGIEPGELARMMDNYKAMKDAEEQGRLIEFPVAVGDRIYEPFGNGFINEGTVCELTKFYQELEIGVSFDGTPTAINTINADHIGKTVFCTREEAEAKLKELGADNAENHETE